MLTQKTVTGWILRTFVSRDKLTMQGRPQDLGRGGARNIFFSDLEICMSRSDMPVMAKPSTLLGGLEFFLEWCNLVRFGVYLDQILSLKNFKNYHFYIKQLKIHVEIHINYSCTHMLGISGAYAGCPEKILKMWCSLVRFGVYFDQIVSSKISKN